MRTAYKSARIDCPLTRCDWSSSTGSPGTPSEWASVHLALAEMLTEHLRDDHGAESAISADRWYVTTDFFANGGTVYDDWGPCPTSEMAMRVRAFVEAGKGRYDLFVDKR